MKRRVAPARWRRWALGLVGAWLLLTVGPVLVLRFVDPPTTAFMVQRRLEAEARHEKGFVLRQQWVPRARVSTHLQRALLAAEDQKFLTHSGFDVQAIEDALEEHLEGRSKRGASTLTQQVAKNLFLWPERSFVRKGLEVWFTVLLELCWSKARILEVHLNVAEYGDGVYGVEQAARLAFGKSAAALTEAEAAALVVVLPSPRTRKVNAPGEKTRQRAAWVLAQMPTVKLDGL